jgi:hypothetical protein
MAKKFARVEAGGGGNGFGLVSSTSLPGGFIWQRRRTGTVIGGRVEIGASGMNEKETGRLTSPRNVSLPA